MAKAGKGLSIAQRANRSWRAQIRRKGFPAESRDFLTHAEADAWGLRRLSELAQTGRLVDRRLSERITLSLAIEAYIAGVTDKRPSAESATAERARLRRFQREEAKLCSHSLAYLTSRHFEEWRDRRLSEFVVMAAKKERPIPHGRFRADGSLRSNASPEPTPVPRRIKPGTVKREMTLLKRVLDFSTREYDLASNCLAVALVDRPAVQDARDVRLDRATWLRLLDECRRSKNTWLAPFIEVALEIGSRRGSLLKLMWSDVFLGRTLVILRGVKNSRAPSDLRTVEVGLSPRAIEILSDLPRSIDGRVFPTTGSAIAGAFKTAKKRAGVENFRIHDTSHELASRLVEEGWGILDVMAQGDWRDPKSVKRYYTAQALTWGRSWRLLIAATNDLKRSHAMRIDKLDRFGRSFIRGRVCVYSRCKEKSDAGRNLPCGMLRAEPFVERRGRGLTLPVRPIHAHGRSYIGSRHESRVCASAPALCRSSRRPWSIHTSPSRPRL